MSAKSQSGPFIPEEIIASILSKLDVIDVGRCRCVCRRWKDLTSDDDFMESLHRRSPPMIYAAFQMHRFYEIDSHYLIDRWWEGAPRRIKCSFPAYRRGDYHYDLCAEGSQNGFIFLRFGSVCIIINPINREEVRIILPRCRSISTSILGIFLHPVSRTYCTIWQETDSSGDALPRVKFMMLNLETQPSWRVIKNPFSKGPEKFEVLDELAVFVEHFFYWFFKSYGVNDAAPLTDISIMAFDTKTEELSLMTLPHDCITNYYESATIHNVDGFLSIAKAKSDGVKIRIKIWTLKDRDRTLWTCLDHVFNCVNHFKNPYVVGIMDEKVVFGLDGREREILVGNLNHTTLRKLVGENSGKGCDWNGRKGCLQTVFFHKPSLASLKTCKPLIRLVQENMENDYLVECDSSSSNDLNFILEDIMNLKLG